MQVEPTSPDDEPAHDILAAEAFAVPAPDPALRHGRVVLPEDPSGIAEPHDILAAEEFAMPAPLSPGAARVLKHRATAPRVAALGAGATLLVLLGLRRRKRFTP